MIRKAISKKTRFSLGFFSVLALLLGYTLLSDYQHRRNPKDTVIPNWGQLGEGVQKIVTPDRFGERWLLVDAQATGLRLFLGMTLAVALSLLIGIHMGCFPKFEALLYPSLSLLAKIPPTAAMAVLFVIAGRGYALHITVITFGVLPTMAMAVYLAVKSFPDELQFKAYTLGASHSEVVWTLLFRFVLPKLIETTRLTIGPAIVFLIASEVAFESSGFGYRIRLQYKLVAMDVIYPYLAVLAGFGFLIDHLLRRLERRLCPWSQHR